MFKFNSEEKIPMDSQFKTGRKITVADICRLPDTKRFQLQ